jgi:hypothetical protein
LFSHHLSRRGARIGALIAAAALFIPAVSAAAQTATSDTSPVNLSNSINMANGKAQAAATVVEGDARFEVLAPEVIRMEYSPAGSFLDEPTFDIMDRDFTVPAYTSSVSDGELTITTSQMTLSYQVGSGPFTAVNTKMQLLGALPPGSLRGRHPDLGLGVHVRPGLPGRRGQPERRGVDSRRPPQLPQPGRVRRRAERDRG